MKHETPDESSLRTAVAALAVLTLLLPLAACNPFKRPTAVMYTLTPPSPTTGVEPTVSRLAVGEPAASEAEGGHRIVVQEGRHALKHLAGAQWLTRAPLMLQTQLIQSFEATGKVETLYRDDFGLTEGYSLESELRELRAVFDERGKAPPEIRVRMAARLRELSSGGFVGRERFSASAIAGDRSPEAIVAAFDDVVNEVCSDLVGWTLATAGPSPGGR